MHRLKNFADKCIISKIYFKALQKKSNILSPSCAAVNCSCPCEEMKKEQSSQAVAREFGAENKDEEMRQLATREQQCLGR